MCELKVFLKEDGRIAEVAHDIIYAKILEQRLILKDALGGSKTIEGALVDELDISKETLSLVKEPIILKVLSFLTIYNTAKASGVYDQRIEEAWEEVKAEGDRCIREAWARLGGRR